jgi:hypothetical protein
VDRRATLRRRGAASKVGDADRAPRTLAVAPRCGVAKKDGRASGLGERGGTSLRAIHLIEAYSHRGHLRIG